MRIYIGVVLVIIGAAALAALGYVAGDFAATDAHLRELTTDPPALPQWPAILALGAAGAVGVVGLGLWALWRQRAPRS